MVGLPGFTDNPFVSRSDLMRAAQAIIGPIENHRSRLGARVKIHPASAAGFDDVAAQLEGFARPLLAIGAVREDSELLRKWCRGLENGVDPNSEEYWGDLGNKDQRMVEMESISIALLSSSEIMLPMMSRKSQTNLRNWLLQINNYEMPANNWRWFRILVNLLLTQNLGVALDEVEGIMAADFDMLDSHYLGDGWSSDGVWGETRKQADYYSGSFAIQFCQLLFVQFAKSYETRKNKYRQQAKEFGAQYWRYFDTDGAAIPFGRSMTYRFAFAGFWAAAAVSGVDLPEPVHQLGVVKGLILRHLRWWIKHPDIFNSDGILNIGFAYPNMYLSENYNSPQSVYWCLKAFLILLLPDQHEFWQCKELPHPLSTKEDANLSVCKSIRPPFQIIDSSLAHHYMLSSGQMTKMQHKAREAKYCKFAYSSTFGFSVPTGPTLEQMAPDSTLSLSIDGGGVWKVRSEPSQVCFGTALVGNKEVDSLKSTWSPWKALDLQVETTLVPLAQYAPGWHLRIHRVRWSSRTVTALLTDRIMLIDAGFAIPALNAKGYHVPQVASWGDFGETGAEGSFCGVSRAVVKSGIYTGGVSNVASDIFAKTAEVHSKALMLNADPNTSLIHQRTFIPYIQHSLGAGEGDSEAWLITGVFAAVTTRITQQEVYESWLRKPTVVRDGPEGRLRIDIV